jgi:phage terminase large subunit GpA-like protein
VRNEAYDCWKMALAALRIAGIDLTRRAAQSVTRAQRGASSGGLDLSNWKRGGR